MAQTKKSIRDAYNRRTYHNYVVRVRRQSSLHQRIQTFIESGASISQLAIELLCKHFGEPFPHPELDQQ